MIRMAYALPLVFLLSCTSAAEKMAAPFKPYDAILLKKPTGKPGDKSADSFAMGLEKVPDTLARGLRAFAIAFPQNAASESYLYAATLLSERSGRKFETAKWCEEFIQMYPKSPWYKDALVAAAHNYEMTGTFEKAILYHKRIAKEFKGTPLAGHAETVLKMLNLGITTPEQQFEYMMKHRKDSTASN